MSKKSPEIDFDKNGSKRYLHLNYLFVLRNGLYLKRNDKQDKTFESIDTLDCSAIQRILCSPYKPSKIRLYKIVITSEYSYYVMPHRYQSTLVFILLGMLFLITTESDLAHAQSSSTKCFSYYVSNSYYSAIDCYQKYLEATSKDTRAMMFLGRSYEGISDYSEALKIFQNIVRFEPNNMDGLSGIARNYDHLGQCEKSIPYYEKVLAMDPKHIEAKIFMDSKSTICEKSTSSVVTYDVKPLLTNGYILSYETNVSTNSLILDIQTDGTSGEMQLTLPRFLIDATLDNNDDVFFVFLDGIQVEYDEISKNSSERVIQFSIPSNSHEVEIIGTFVEDAKVIPEFPIMALPVITMSLLLIIVITRKNSFSLRS